MKCGQFADDLWTTLKACSNTINAILRELDNFAKFSGLVVNPTKCAVLHIGPWHNSEAKFYTMKKLFWSPKSIKILGIYKYPDSTVMYSDNCADLPDKVENVLKALQHHSFTIMSVVINTLVNTLFIHKFLALPSP